MYNCIIQYVGKRTAKPLNLSYAHRPRGPACAAKANRASTVCRQRGQRPEGFASSVPGAAWHWRTSKVNMGRPNNYPLVMSK